MGYTANRRKTLNTQQSALSYAEKRRRELGAKEKGGQVDAAVKKTDAREVMAKKSAAGTLPVKKDNKLTFGKVVEAVKRIPSVLADKESQQAIRQPVWNAIDKAAAFNDVQGAEMRKYAFGDVNNELQNGYKPTTGNATVDTVARTAGMISSAFLPSGGGPGASMSTPVRNFAEFVANKVAPNVGNVVGRVGNVALRGTLESLPYTAQQLFVGDKKSIGEMAKVAGRDVIFGIVTELGIEGAGELFKSIGTKMKKGIELSAKEKAIVDEASMPTGIVDDAEIELQDAITTPRPQAEIDQIAEELRNAEPVAQTKVDAEQVNTPPTNQVAQNGTESVAMPKVETPAKSGTTMSERVVSTSGTGSLMADRKVKAYMFENPEVKTRYQGAASYILEFEYVPNEQFEVITPIMKQLKADTGLTPAQVKDALERLVEDHGQENVAAAKRVEVVIDDMLSNGFDMFDGTHIDADEGYLKLKSIIEGREIKPIEKVDSGEFEDAFMKQEDAKNVKAYEANVPKETKSNVIEFKPKTPKQAKYVEQVTAKLPNDADGLSRKIAELETAKSVEKDGQKLLKINLQLFAAKKKLEGLSEVYSNTLKNTDAIPQEVKKLLDEDDFRYDPLTEKQQTETARAKIGADTEGELKRIQDLSRTEYNQDDVNVGMELLRDLSNKADLSDTDIANIRKTAKGVSQAGRTQGRGVQAFAKYTRTKEGVIASTQKVVDKVEDSIKKTNPKLINRVKKEADAIADKLKKEGKEVDYDKILSQVKKKYKIPDLTDDDIKKIADYMDKYKNAEQGSREAKEAWYKVMQVMSSKIPPTLVDKFRGLQRVSYLLNPKTLLVRNPTGNVVMNIAETIKDLPGAMVDKVTSAIRKSDRTTSLPSVGRLKAQFEGGKVGLGEALKDIKAGVDTSPTVGMLEMPRRDVFSNSNPIGRALNKADKLVGQMLQLGDRPFYQAAYEERISDLLKLGKTKEVTQEMMDKANDYALERVFQNDSGIAQVFKALKTPPAKAPQGLKDAWGFIVNGVIPFSKTPANILNKLLEYSPVGLAKAIGHGAYSKAGKTVFNQKYFVDNIARGLTGSGLALLGYAMADKGLIKGKTDSDKDVAALERLMGINAYSITIDGKSFTFDWAQPIGSVLAAGADAYYSGMDKDNISEQLSAALQGYGNTFFNQSMMQSLTRFLNTYNPISGVVNSVMNTSNIITPTLGAQVARTIDPYVRDTTADSPLMEQANKLLARTPGMSITLPKKIDTLGQEQKQSQGRNIVARAVEQFISPGYFGDTSKADVTMKRVYNVYKATNNKSVFPKLAPDDFTLKGDKIKLTAEQKREWQKLSGKYYSEKFNKRIDGKSNDEARAKALKKLADDAYDYAKKELF